MTGHLSFLAGRKAYARLRTQGFAPDAVKVVAGAAGGPKWLALSQLDRALFGEVLKGRREPLFLLGSSIGSWRFAAVSQKDPLAAIDRFEAAYLAQRYSDKPTAREVSATSAAVLHGFLSGEALHEALGHPSHRLSIIAARCRWPVANDAKAALLLGLGSAALCNVLSKNSLGLFFKRTVLYDARTPPPYLHAPGFQADAVALTTANLSKALLASGSIPLVMAGVDGIADAPEGVYRDGGVIDYHLNVPFLDQAADELVLFPHFGERLVPGWFDKNLPWRKPAAERMAHVLLVAPSPRFLARLPYGKIPDRSDFTRFKGHDTERIKYWRTVIDECRHLADEFLDVVAKGRIAEVLRPMPE